MARIEREVVASGVIGQFNNKWSVHRLTDKKNDSECYNLYINEEYIDYYSSVAKALYELAEQFISD